MPYPMVHMCIAKKVMDLNPNIIKDLPQYFLGSLAPDAVHFREGFKPSDKKISHLCVGDERWGEATNNDEWIENVLTYLKKYKKAENVDFMYGYCAHILGDIRNNIKFWIPMKLKLYNSIKIPDTDVYASEARETMRLDEIDVDNRLYNAIFQSDIRDFLSKATGTSLEDIITKEEVNRIRDNILYTQYKNVSADSSYVGKYVTYEAYLDFIEETTEIISKLLFS